MVTREILPPLGHVPPRKVRWTEKDFQISDINRGLRAKNALFCGNQLYYDSALRKIFPKLSNLHLILPKKIIRKSLNGNLTNEIAGLNFYSYSGAASFNRSTSEIEHR